MVFFFSNANNIINDETHLELRDQSPEAKKGKRKRTKGHCRLHMTEGYTCYRGELFFPFISSIIRKHENSKFMYHRIALRSRIPRVTITAVQKGHARTLTTVDSRPATDQPGRPRPKMMGIEKETLYIAGGLAAIGAIWYYYATVENARIEKRREGRSANESAEGGRAQAIGDASRPVKDRAKEALKSAQ